MYDGGDGGGGGGVAKTETMSGQGSTPHSAFSISWTSLQLLLHLINIHIDLLDPEPAFPLCPNGQCSKK
ncbi:Protein of unknown function [Pyronema omphalodes CBS 100304]|uniref:Uncharacterized protein n=1 Tax=Pyronema omphalodes (strain CBS 100304) TaxID=1076935 RepID=U4LG51_PYROM|nr:Protein of unknown function [Pyronema omphalodes CBS 100304]